MSPLAKPVLEAGQAGLKMKVRPFEIGIDDFFQPVENVKKLFAQLINAPSHHQIALIPSVSYGIANATQNIQLTSEQNIVMLHEQFPSNFYSWKRLSERTGATIKAINAPYTDGSRTEAWNTKILEAIDEKTGVVAMSHTHWADGTLFDLAAIGQKCKAVGAYFIIDGTQSIGALPFDVEEFQVDVLICAAYKWLMGPYSSGLAYFSERFNGGTPIEESWLYRKDSHLFSNLVNYQSEYREGANRYCVGESANFILIPMLEAALKMLLSWKIEHIQTYCRDTFAAAVNALAAMGCAIEKPENRAHHLFGVRTQGLFDANALQAALKQRNVLVSMRGDAIRISPNVYNEAHEMDVLVECFQKALK